jgi:hypothetical protein
LDEEEKGVGSCAGLVAYRPGEGKGGCGLAGGYHGRDGRTRDGFLPFAAPSWLRVLLDWVLDEGRWDRGAGRPRWQQSRQRCGGGARFERWRWLTSPDAVERKGRWGVEDDTWGQGVGEREEEGVVAGLGVPRWLMGRQK